MSTVGGPRLSTIPSFINTYSLDFDGIDDYVDVGEIPPLFKNFPIGTAKDNPWSTSIWVNGNTANGVFLEFPYVEVNSLYAYSFAFAFKSKRSILPSSAVSITITFIPVICADAGLVPWAEDGIKQIFLFSSPLLR